MKKVMKSFLLALCVVMFAATAGWCIDPFKVNEGGFGPKIKGLQLGMKLEGAEIASYGMVKNPENYGATAISLRKDDGRIIELNFLRYNFGAGQMTVREFVQAFINAYGIPGMDGEGDRWRYRNLSEGWEVVVYADSGMVEVKSVIVETAFD